MNMIKTFSFLNEMSSLTGPAQAEGRFIGSWSRGTDDHLSQSRCVEDLMNHNKIWKSQWIKQACISFSQSSPVSFSFFPPQRLCVNIASRSAQICSNVTRPGIRLSASSKAFGPSSWTHFLVFFFSTPGDTCVGNCVIFHSRRRRKTSTWSIRTEKESQSSSRKWEYYPGSRLQLIPIRL